MDTGYPCIDGCPHLSFPTRKGLTIHQRKCKTYIDRERALAARFELEDSERPSKRRRTHEPVSDTETDCRIVS